VTDAAKLKSKDRHPRLRRRGGCSLGLILSLLAVLGLLAANTVIVDSRTRPAQARDGGEIIDSGVVPANVKVEGSGPPLVLIHGFGAALLIAEEAERRFLAAIPFLISAWLCSAVVQGLTICRHCTRLYADPTCHRISD